MDFLKKHYEKVLLGAVLLGLAVAVGFLPFKITSDKEELEKKRDQLIHPNVKPLANQDLAQPESMLQRLTIPVALDFSAPHKLFNPMPWQKAQDGRLIKVNETKAIIPDLRLFIFYFWYFTLNKKRNKFVPFFRTLFYI